MSMNTVYRGPGDCPETMAVFPLPGALLLPRGQIPLNIFEPRYLAMVDDALRGHRVIGMIQPDEERPAIGGAPGLFAVGCAGRITQFAETGDGRYLITLTGIARFRLVEELTAMTPYRQARVDFSGFPGDFTPRLGEAEVDREALVSTLRDFADANRLGIDWDGVESAPNEALVNALAMLSPFGPREKQALLEAADLKARGDLLVALTQIDLARRTGGEGEGILQ